LQKRVGLVQLFVSLMGNKKYMKGYFRQ